MPQRVTHHFGTNKCNQYHYISNLSLFKIRSNGFMMIFVMMPMKSMMSLSPLSNFYFESDTNHNQQLAEYKHIQSSPTIIHHEKGDRSWSHTQQKGAGRQDVKPGGTAYRRTCRAPLQPAGASHRANSSDCCRKRIRNSK